MNVAHTVDIMVMLATRLTKKAVYEQPCVYFRCYPVGLNLFITVEGKRWFL